MTVPEAAMHEDHGLVFRQNNIWFARQILDVQAEAIAEAMEQRPDYLFRLCVFAGDGLHVAASLLRCMDIHQGIPAH